MVIFKDKFTKVFSKMHPETFDRFSCDNVKNRQQIGKVSDKYTDEQIQSAAISYDIPKCYRYCLSNPLSPWMFLTYNDIWEAYSPKMGLPYGLYLIQTNDFSLFRGDNIYANDMVQFAKAEDIKIEILSILRAEERHTAFNFTDIIEEFKIKSGGDQQIFKLMCNLLSGMMGKTESKNARNVRFQSANVNSEQHMLHHVERFQAPFLNFHFDSDGNKYHVYGDLQYKAKLQHNLPLYLQITDHSNIILYKHIQEVGGDLCYRKTDFFSCIGGMDIGENKPDGGFRREDNPVPKEGKNLTPMRIDNVLDLSMISLPKWKDQPTFTSSSQWEDIMDFAVKIDGLLVLGRAGCGKSHIIKQISKHMGTSNTVRLAYTNKATNIIDGRTIHSFLSLKINDPHSPMSEEQVGWMVSSTPIVLLDEVSMLDGNLWFYLTELKRLTGCVFICFGDYRQ